MRVDEMKTAQEGRDQLLADPAFRAEWDRTAFSEAVAMRVVDYRVENHLTQTALGRMLGMKQPAIARLEAGDVIPSLDTLSRLSKVLGIEFHIDITSEGVAV